MFSDSSVMMPLTNAFMLVPCSIPDWTNIRDVHVESSVKETKIRRALGVTETETQKRRRMTNWLHSRKIKKTLTKFNAKIAVMFRKALIFGIKILAKRLPLEDYFVYRKARGLFNMIYMIKLITKMKLTQRNEAKDKKSGRSLLKFVFFLL